LAGIETVDISLVDGVPTVLQVLAAVRANHVVTEAFMAEEFARENTPATQAAFAAALAGIKVGREAHGTLKQRVPGAIGLIRTGRHHAIFEPRARLRLKYKPDGGNYI